MSLHEGKTVERSGTKVGKNRSRQPQKLKSMRPIELRWICDDKIVRAVCGGGVRKLNVKCDMNAIALMENGKDLFFKDGKSSMGGVEEFIFCLKDFQRNIVEDHITIGDMYDTTKLQMLRFYLESKRIEKKLPDLPTRKRKAACATAVSESCSSSPPPTAIKLQHPSIHTSSSQPQSSSSSSSLEECSDKARLTSDAVLTSSQHQAMSSNSSSRMFNLPTHVLHSDQSMCSGQNVNVTECKKALKLKFFRETESSYSEVTTRLNCYSIEECMTLLTGDSDWRDSEMGGHDQADDCNPLRYGYKLAELECEGHTVLQTKWTENGMIVTFPSSTMFTHCESMIMYGPEQVFGFDGKYFILGAVCVLHGQTCVEYAWSRNGTVFERGQDLALIVVSPPGEYRVSINTQAVGGEKLEFNRNLLLS